MVYHIHGISGKWFCNVVKKNLIDQFKQTWSTSVDNSPKALNYRLCKKGISFENYLEFNNEVDDEVRQRLAVIKYRFCYTGFLVVFALLVR